MTPGQIARQPLSALFAGMAVVYVALVLAAPEVWLRLAAKEGPFEHTGHAVLALCAVLWLGLALRASGRARVVAGCVLAYLCLALLEELDWGHVYGVDLGHSLVAAWTGGSFNFHNAQKSHASLAGWSVVWMSAPMLVFFGLALVPLGRVRSWWSTCAPASSEPGEAWAFLLVALATLVVDGLPLLERRLGYVPRAGAGDPIGAPLGLFQIAFYLAWALVALRALRALGRAPSTRAPAGVP